MRASLRVSLVCLACVASACASLSGAEGEATRSDDGPDIREYYPLAVGNSWRYSGKMLGHEVEREIEVLRKEKGWFVDSTGARLNHDRFGLRDERRYLMRYPVSPGSEWMSVVGPSAVERYQIVGIGSEVSVPAGSFKDCLVVEARQKGKPGQTLVHRAVYAKGVGLIRIGTSMEILREGQKVPEVFPQVSLELASYQLAKAP